MQHLTSYCVSGWPAAPPHRAPARHTPGLARGLATVAARRAVARLAALSPVGRRDEAGRGPAPTPCAHGC